MTRDEIIDLAEKAGCDVSAMDGREYQTMWCDVNQLERFAALVAAHKCEELAAANAEIERQRGAFRIEQSQADKAETEAFQLAQKLLAAQAVIEQMRETIQHHSDCQNCCIHDGDSEALSIQSPTDTLKARDRKRDAALLREFAENCLPNVRRKEPEASIERSLHNTAVADCIKHALYLSRSRLSGDWEPELEVK